MSQPYKVFDPRVRIVPLQKDAILYAFAQSQGKNTQQEDALVHFGDECFILCDGVGTIPHGAAAAKLASETALWAYKAVRLRRCYWADKRQLVRRIFRSTNLTIWQKHREEGFTDGLATTLLVAIIGPRAVWVGSVGDSSCFVFHEGKLLRLVRQDRDTGKLTRALGFMRLGVWPNATQQKFLPGDSMILTSDGVSDVVSTNELSDILCDAGETNEAFAKAANAILAKAKANGGAGNMTVCLIKRIALLR